MPKLRTCSRAFGTAIAALSIAAAATSQCPRSWTALEVENGVNGNVRAITNWDPDGPGPLSEHVVVAGSFSMAAGKPATNIAMFKLSTQEWSPLGVGLPSAGYALTVATNGDLLAATDSNVERRAR